MMIRLLCLRRGMGGCSSEMHGSWRGGNSGLCSMGGGEARDVLAVVSLGEGILGTFDGEI